MMTHVCVASQNGLITRRVAQLISRILASRPTVVAATLSGWREFWPMTLSFTL